MKMLSASKELIAAESAIIEVIRISKLSNPQSMIGISEADIDYLIKNIARDYLMYDFEHGKKNLDIAVSQFFAKAQQSCKINIGDFMRLCHAQDLQVKEGLKTQRLIAGGKRCAKSDAVENIAKLKELLKDVVGRSLPYNKEIRVTESRYSEIGESGKHETEMGAHELREHLSKKRMLLHNDLYSFGQLRHWSDIENTELRELYLKAWSDKGVTRVEKDRMQELCSQTGERIVGI